MKTPLRLTFVDYFEGIVEGCEESVSHVPKLHSEGCKQVSSCHIPNKYRLHPIIFGLTTTSADLSISEKFDIQLL